MQNLPYLGVALIPVVLYVLLMLWSEKHWPLDWRNPLGASFVSFLVSLVGTVLLIKTDLIAAPYAGRFMLGGWLIASVLGGSLWLAWQHRRVTRYGKG